MHRAGHYGVALLIYAPVDAVALALGVDELALLGVAVAVGEHLAPARRHSGNT